jgi:hypothetical protein
MENDWGYWCKVQDTDSICSQMEQIENEYSLAKEKGIVMKEYVTNNNLWEIVTERYIQYLNSRI